MLPVGGRRAEFRSARGVLPFLSHRQLGVRTRPIHCLGWPLPFHVVCLPPTLIAEMTVARG
jgi:hypothetical protein